MARVIGVLGGSGGVGASVFAAVLASVAAADGHALLVDLDVTGAGADVLLDIESAPGARWSGLRLAGGQLDAQVLLDGLPAWRGSFVLAADVDELDAGAVSQVLDAVDESVDTVVLDLPRRQCAERSAALLRCDLVVLVVRADICGVVAAHAQAQALPDVPVGALARRGEVSAAKLSALVGVPLLGRLPRAQPGSRGVDMTHVPRGVRAVAAAVLAGLVLEPVPA